MSDNHEEVEEPAPRRDAAMTDDRKRARLLDLMRSGAPLRDAAEDIGCTRQAVQKHTIKFPEFRDELEAARVAGLPHRATYKASRPERPPEPQPDPEPPPVEPIPKPPPPIVEPTRAVMALLSAPKRARRTPRETPPEPQEERTIVDGEPVREQPAGAPLRGDDEYQNVLQLCWWLAYGGETVHPVVQQKAVEWLCKKTIGIDLYERERAADAEAKRQMRIAEREAAESETQTTDGPLIIGVPSNGSEAPGREPATSTIIDAEVVH